MSKLNCKKCPAWIPQPHSIQFSGVGPEHEPASTIQPASVTSEREKEREGDDSGRERERERDKNKRGEGWL